MPIEFSEIPIDFEVPGVFTEFSPSAKIQALFNRPLVTLLFAHRLSTGTIAELVLKRVSNNEEAELWFGRGSQAHLMVRQFRKINRRSELWVITLDEDAGGDAAAGTITVTGPATASGTIQLYVGGEHVQVPVVKGDIATAIATNIRNKINAKTDLPVTATVLAAVVTVTARWKGETGNDIDMRANIYQGQALPSGVALAFVQLSGGATNPDLTAALAEISGSQFHIMANPFTDAANMNVLEAELLARWNALVGKEGFAHIAYNDNYADTITYGLARNSPFVTAMPAKDSPSPTWLWSAAMAAVDASNLDPAANMIDTRLTGILAPSKQQQLSQEEFDSLLKSGFSHYTVSQEGQVQVGKLITMYRTNAQNIADASYKPHRVPKILSFMRYLVNAEFRRKYSKFKLAPDTSPDYPGLKVMKPIKAKAELFTIYKAAEARGILVNVDLHKDEIIAELDDINKSRINASSILELIGHMEQLASLVEFQS